MNDAMRLMLSTEEKQLYTILKNTIKNGLVTFVQVGKALLEIRDKKLYREQYGDGSESFEKMCRTEFKINRRYANQLIEGSKTVTTLGAMAPESVRERTVRPLGGLPPRDKKKAFAEAQKQAEAEDRPVTGKDVKRAVKNLPKRNGVKKEAVKDGIGRTIPEALLPIWNDKDQIQAIVSAVSKIKAMLDEAELKKNPVFSALNFQAVNSIVEQLYHKLKYSMPYAVCGICQGLGCKACKTGLMTKHAWELQVPAETRKMIIDNLK